MDPTTPLPGTVVSLHRFPVKSMLGEDLDSCDLQASGVVGDRGYALVDAIDGTVASAKHPRKWGALLHWSARYLDEPVAGGPLPPVELLAPDGTVLRSDAPGIDSTLSAAVGRAVRLSREPVSGALFEEVWPQIEGLAPQEFIASTTTDRESAQEPISALALGMLTSQATFLDLCALHLLTTSTLAELSRLAPDSEIDARRFRPNVVVSTDDPGFAEDSWVDRVVALGGAQARVRMLTMRCVMTTLAQRQLPADPTPLRTIARSHRREIPGLGTWACAGVYADISAAGTVRRGDRVLVG